MNLQTDEELATVAGFIRNHAYTAENCSLIRHLVARTGGKSVIMTIIAEGRQTGLDDYEAFTALQQSLQDLADIDPVTGLILMVHLSEPASALYFHDIWDWTNIAMWEMRSDEVTQRLREVIAQESDPALKESYSRWL